jgi:hypothetical protein
LDFPKLGESGRSVLVSGAVGIFAFPNGETGSAGQVGVDKKMQTSEHFVIKKRWAGKVRPAAVICVEWIQSAGHGEQEPYCEMTQLQQ